MSDSKQGTVKWFNNAKGYGFITPSEGGQDLFVHMSNIVMEGYGIDPMLGKYWLVRNSWGPNYGEKGYIRLRRYENNEP